jgi:hypothetical protein
MSIDQYRAQSRFSDPREHSALFDGVPAEIGDISAVARNVIVHYRAGGVELPGDRLVEIDNRWVDRILATDQARHPFPLSQTRPVADRVAGCCRDFTLLSVAALRHHGIPARSRIGFASYFAPDWHHDHVVAEYWNGDRWVWSDTQLDPAGDWSLDVHDIDPHAGHFDSAATVWSAYRAGKIDPDLYGVDPGLPHLCGPWLIYNYVLLELAHRQGDETLLWDSFGAMEGTIADADVALADEIAALLLAADAGDTRAEQELAARYAADPRLHPGDQIHSISPASGEFRPVDLRR